MHEFTVWCQQRFDPFTRVCSEHFRGSGDKPVIDQIRDYYYQRFWFKRRCFHEIAFI